MMKLVSTKVILHGSNLAVKYTVPLDNLHKLGDLMYSKIAWKLKGGLKGVVQFNTRVEINSLIKQDKIKNFSIPKRKGYAMLTFSF